MADGRTGLRIGFFAAALPLLTWAWTATEAQLPPEAKQVVVGPYNADFPVGGVGRADGSVLLLDRGRRHGRTSEGCLARRLLALRRGEREGRHGPLVRQRPRSRARPNSGDAAGRGGHAGAALIARNDE